MNIEKIKNYNQRMLAVICTLGAVLLTVCIIMLIIDMLPQRGYKDQPQGLISDERTEILNQENLRKQIISYESPWLIDTLHSIYIVPVSIKTLKKPEEVAQEIPLGLQGQLNLFGSSKKGEGYYGRRHFEGKYANLIIYNPNEGKTTSLFTERVFIGEVTSYYFKDDILLVFHTASKDTDKNGVIDLSDLRSLCVYSLQTGIMRKISDNDNQVEGYTFIENSKDLLVEFKLSQYKENQFDNYQSPSKIMQYRFDSQKLSDIIPEKIQADMQKLVEGK